MSEPVPGYWSLGKALFLCAHMTTSSHKCRGRVEEVFGSTFYKDINDTGPELALTLFNLNHFLRGHTSKYTYTGSKGFYT